MHTEPDNSAEFYKLIDQRPSGMQPKQGNKPRQNSVRNSFAIDARQQSIANLGFDIEKEMQVLEDYNSNASPEPVLKDEENKP